MNTVTALRTSRKDRQHVKVYLDGRFAFTLEAETVVRQGVRLGQELSAEELDSLARLHRQTGCLDAALHLLTYRPRSEAELRQRLARRGFESREIEPALARLRRQGFVDDDAFARFWKESRDTFSPRSGWLTGRELRQKGVPEDVIRRVVADTDDAESAYQAAAARAQRLRGLDYQVFYRRLGEYLRRRGFGYGVIKQTVKRLWEEQEQQG